MLHARDLYHLIRRHATRRAPVGAPYSFAPVPVPPLQIRPPVPRGCAPARDAMARAFGALRAAPADPLATPVTVRVRARLLALYEAEIRRRGGEIEIVDENREVGLDILHRAKGLTLVGCDGWRYYSRRFGSRRASIRYLCGVDDNGRWAARVPGTVCTVAGALEWLEPAAVREARAAGVRVVRQGDIYLIGGGRRDSGLADLPGSHRWDAATRTLEHTPADGRAHAPIVWGAEPVRVVPQRRFTEASASRGFARD